MSYGFTLKNEKGDIVVDGEHPCSYLHEKGVAHLYNSMTSAGGAAKWHWRIPDKVEFSTPVATEEPPFVVGHSGATPVSMGPMIGIPGRWTGFLCYSPWWPRSGALTDAQFSLEYAVFSRKGTYYSKSDFGMQAFNKKGEPIFDSRKFPFILEGGFNYRRFGGSSGTQVYSNYNGYEDAARALTQSGVIVETPSEKHWPLLSGLNQMIHIEGVKVHPSESEYSTNGGILKICVQRVGPTRWKYRFGVIIESGRMGVTPIMSDYDRVPNFGGGMGAVNLLLTAPVP